MDANIELNRPDEVPRVDVAEAARRASADLLFRYDRVMVALSVVAGAGLVVREIIHSGVHPIAALAAAGTIGGMVTLLCISIIWGAWSSMRPLGWAAINIIALGAINGLVFGVVMGLLWLAQPAAMVPVGLDFIHRDWFAWQAMAAGAVFIWTLKEVVDFAWLWRSTGEVGLLEALAGAADGPDLEAVGGRKQEGVLALALLIIGFSVPFICLLVPVWLALYIGNRYLAIWPRWIEMYQREVAQNGINKSVPR